jgi:RimJ/RimL family protein N-acetyltransferase
VPLALRTPRLLLREWREEDRAPFAAMSADPDVMRYLPAPDDGWIDRAVEHWRRHGCGFGVVELPGVASFIGTVGLNHVRVSLPFTPAVEVGWRLARPYWGQGYAYEAARAAIEDGFGRLGLAEIVAYTVPANRTSWRLMERLGMRRDPAEDFEHPRLPEGDPLRTHILYRLRRAAA